jgi:hypothetical protein
MIPAPIVASLAEQPAYYALYALYADYAANNGFHRAREYFARLREIVRFIQPLQGKEQPYMQSWSLRLFSEREALARFTPEQASAAWRLVRQVVDEIGLPAGWQAPTSAGPGRPLQRPGRREVRARAPAFVEALPRPAVPAFPRSPVDYRRAV